MKNSTVKNSGLVWDEEILVSKGPSKIVPIVLLAIWGAAVVAGLLMLVDYSYSAGAESDVLKDWPIETSVSIELGAYQLLVFLHPKCPCSRSTVNELKRILINGSDEFSTSVVFYYPGNEDPSWVQGQLFRESKLLEGCSIHLDKDGEETRRFGVTTSGHVLLFDEQGQVVFSGGITVGRGHDGASVGSQAVIDLLNGKVVETCELPVFGCSIIAGDSNGT